LSTSPGVIAAYGPILHGTGWHDHASGFFRALHRRHPVAAMNDGRQAMPRDVPPDVLEMLAHARRLGGEPADVGIGIGAIEDLSRVEGDKRIGFAVWETSILRTPDVRRLQQLDEVWTATEWGRQLLTSNGIREELVRVVPEGVDAARFTPAEPSAPRGGRPFRFLCVARWQVRKGLEELIAAFCREFAPHEPVELVLRCITAAWEPPAEQRVAALLRPPHPPVIAIGELLDRQELVDLYRSADAFVLPTKAEGWGLPISEAMACGLPVIVTSYSAPADYLDDSTAYLIRVASMVPAYDPIWYPHPTAFGFWAQPDVEHLQALMRHVYEHPEEAREKGRRAREAVVTRMTWEHAADAACRVLGL
jgi:glycosyltransferase involved in cell wall biosynthesis